MKITKDTIVTLTFRAVDAKGKVLEDGKEPRAYLHGGYGNTLPGVELALEGQESVAPCLHVAGAAHGVRARREPLTDRLLGGLDRRDGGGDEALARFARDLQGDGVRPRSAHEKSGLQVNVIGPCELARV